MVNPSMTRGAWNPCYEDGDGKDSFGTAMAQKTGTLGALGASIDTQSEENKLSIVSIVHYRNTIITS